MRVRAPTESARVYTHVCTHCPYRCVYTRLYPFSVQTPTLFDLFFCTHTYTFYFFLYTHLHACLVKYQCEYRAHMSLQHVHAHTCTHVYAQLCMKIYTHAYTHAYADINVVLATCHRSKPSLALDRAILPVWAIVG